MAFLAKIALISLLATSSLALPSPTSDNENLLTRTLCSRSIDANFEDLKPPIPLPGLPLPSPLPPRVPGTNNLNVVPTPYKDLDWNGGFRFRLAAPEAVSTPNDAFFSAITQVTNDARISIYGTVQSFRLKSLYLGCSLQTQGAVSLFVACTIKVTGTKTNGQTEIQNLNYTPTGLKQFVLPSKFNELKSVVLETDLLTTALTSVIVDSVEYTVRKPC